MKNLLKLKNLYVLIAVAGLAYGGYYFGTQSTETSSNNKTLELTTVAINKGDLEKKEEYNGTLRQTNSKVLNSPMSGVATYIPKEGTIINFGEVLFAIDNKPVILVEGSVPFYRTLDLNSDPGPDVLQVENALVFLGYSSEDFLPDETFDEVTSNMLNQLYIDYKVETKSEVTAVEQVAINLKQTEVESIEETISNGGTTLAEVNSKKKTLEDLQKDSVTTLAEVNSKKKTLDDAIENSTKENTAWQTATNLIEDYNQQISLLKDLTNPRTIAKSEQTRKDEIKSYEDLIEEQKRIREMEEGDGSVVDAAEALAIENAQKAYDDALKSYNEGVDQESELTKAKEELEELKLSAKSETFSPTNAYASESPIIIGSYISDIGSAVSLNSQLYNISSIGIEVVFQVDASDQETVLLYQ